jgi:hypothetical protein
MDLSGAPARLCVPNDPSLDPPLRARPIFKRPRAVLRPIETPREALVVRVAAGADADPPRVAFLPPSFSRRSHVALDLAGEAVPVINYKKLKRAQEASAPCVPAGASGRDPMAGGPGAVPGGAAAMRMGGGLPPGDGAGNHMAAVIRRIEGFYSAPRFDDSDEDERSHMADDADADAARLPDDDAASSEDDDFVDDGRDPNDPAVMKQKAEKKAAREAKKRARSLLETASLDGTTDPSRRAQKRSQKQPEEWYDVEDDFVDDEELDAYFERNGRKDKLGGAGGDRFYVNRGALEFVDDGTGTASALRRSRHHAANGSGGGKEWSGEDMERLRAGLDAIG